MKIIFLGTSKFGVIILQALMANDYAPALVITAPNKPSGRKYIMTPPPVKIAAQAYKLPVEQPEKIKNLKLKIKNLNPDLIIVAAYGQILTQEILDIPKFGCLNIHPSLLPKYRGASPVQYAILNGEQETGVTIMLMDAIMDHGLIIAQKKTAIGPNETFLELHDRLGLLGGKLLVNAIPDWVNGRLQAQRQNEAAATYTKIIKKEDGLINWVRPVVEIERQVRAFKPWPGTYTFWNKKSSTATKRIYVKILAAEAIDGGIVQKKNGEVSLTKTNQLIIQTGKGQLNVLKLQIEGKKPMDSQNFLAGHAGFIGIILTK